MTRTKARANVNWRRICCEGGEGCIIGGGRTGGSRKGDGESSEIEVVIFERMKCFVATDQVGGGLTSG